jgi:hypothetical protein
MTEPSDLQPESHPADLTPPPDPDSLDVDPDDVPIPGQSPRLS